jgi:hypothetical protein
MLAMALQNPDFALDDEEAKRMAKAYAKMQGHYGFEASAKVTDTFAFFMVCASIYGPRALPLIQKITEKKVKVKVTQVKVVD